MELTTSGPAGDKPIGGTNLGRFLAQRGVLLLKEGRQVATVWGELRHQIKVEAWIIARARGQQTGQSFGVRFENIGEGNQTLGSGFLDADEIEELVGAISYIEELAKSIAGQERDYTELTYSSKDNIRVGFYQVNKMNRQAYFDAGGNGRTVFLNFERLATLKQAIESARDHLVSRGATIAPD